MTLENDPAFIKAVKESKTQVAAKESHRRQLARNAARKKASLAVVEARKQAKQSEISAREASALKVSTDRAYAKQQEIALKEASAKNVLANRESLVAGRIAETRKQRRIDNVTSGVSNTVGSNVRSTVTPSSNSGLVMTTIFVMAGLILFYNLVVSADRFSGFVGTVSDFLHKVSSTAPLFSVVPTTPTTS